VARRTGIPTVTTVHGFTFGGWKNRVYEAIQRAAFRRFDAVVAVSRPLAGELARAGVPAGRIRVVPNAWGGGLTAFERATARRLLGVPDGRFHVGWVGRLSWEKGADVFLDAVAALADLPLSVSLFGHGAERGRLEAQARRLGLHRATTLRGNVPHAERLFSAFDCFVLSSRTEGTPIALFEAMAAGVPVVTSAVGGVPDVVSPAEALLVQPCLPSALAEAIRAVYHHPADAQERAVRARARLRAFDPEPWLTRYEQVYESVSHSPALAGHTR
ncbi:MAG: glycosyltransferase, partial [Gemmatimonadetes bacterium]|nr:glycosyltransferase [Gemmatimonadota bacterium]